MGSLESREEAKPGCHSFVREGDLREQERERECVWDGEGASPGVCYAAECKLVTNVTGCSVPQDHLLRICLNNCFSAQSCRREGRGFVHSLPFLVGSRVGCDLVGFPVAHGWMRHLTHSCPGQPERQEVYKVKVNFA